MSATLGPIGQIAYTVSDVPSSVAFYRDAVGLKLLFEAPPGLAFFDCGGVRLMLSKPEGDFKPGSSAVIYFRVTGIESAHQVLKQRGVIPSTAVRQSGFRTLDDAARAEAAAIMDDLADLMLPAYTHRR